MKTLQGLGAAPGVAVGSWVRIEPALAPAGGTIDPTDAAAEIDRLRDAAGAAARELDAIADRVTRDGHPEEAAIFHAQASIARDPALATLAATRINESAEDAVAAIQAAAGTFADQLRSLDDELLAARAADVLDVGRRIARRATGAPDEPGRELEGPAIVVGEDLPPSVTATLPRARLLGIALEGSSPTAHAAILARAYGIPAVVAAPGLLVALQAEEGTGRAHQIAIDGGSGEVVIDPDGPARRRFEAALLDEEARRADALRHAHEPVVTLDGVPVSLLANIGTPEEAAGARELGALGVGLFRTEFLFLERSSPPSEAEQVDAYERVVRTFEPHPVTIRLLDVGGDKPIPYLRLAAEANPFLGVRALRLARTDPELFLTQLRACYRAAAAGPIKVMAPMVADLSDVELLLTLAERAHAQLEAEGRPIGEVTLGVMLEIPSAILVADSYFSRIGFASIGTNDLHQYALAVDRGNAALEAYRDPLHPGVLKLVGMAVEAGNRAGIEISVCGEMAGDPASALALVALGVRSLSMASTSLPGVARAIRAATADELAAAIEVALTAPSAASVRSSFEALAKGAVPA